MATVLDVMSWLGPAIFCAVAAVAFLRWRSDRTHAAAAMAVAVGLIGLLQVQDAVLGENEPAWVARLCIVAFAGVGSAVLEHRAALLGLSGRWRAAAALLLLACGGTLAATGHLGGTASAQRGVALVAGLGLLVVWLLCMLEPAGRLWRAARTAATTQSAQLRLLAGSYVGMAVVVLSGAVRTAPDGPGLGGRLALEGVTVAIACLLFTSLHAPAFLRRYWLRSQTQRLVDRLHPVPRWYVDLDTQTTWWSPALRALLGVGDDEPASVEGFIARLHEDDRDGTAAALDRQLADRKAATATLRVRRAGDGEIVWVEVTSDVVMDLESRRAVGLYGTITDVTVHKLTEKRLQEALAAAQRATDKLAVLSEELRFQSLHDPLTGLANRSLFVAQLDNAWVHYQRYGGGLAVLVLDLDGFKTVNDVHGHVVGDELLATVAERLLACVRGGDTVARLGGDEFVIVLPATSITEAGSVADRVLRAVAERLVLDGEPYVVAMSIGIAEASARHAGPADLVREADAALYAAKAAGRGTYEIYAPGQEAAASVVVPGVVAAEARAWQAYVGTLRAEIAQRKVAGALPAGSRAPEALLRVLQRVLAAIDEQCGHGWDTGDLVLPAGRDLEEFAFHHTAVQHWADALVASGELGVGRSPEADRFWGQLARAVAGHDVRPYASAGQPLA